MISLMIGCISNIILDPLLIFGVGIFPEMGIRGAALATGLGQVFTVIVYLIAYKKCSIPVEISRKYLELNRNLDGKLYICLLYTSVIWVSCRIFLFRNPVLSDTVQVHPARWGVV